LIKILNENDNSQNPFDDSFYLAQIVESLGNLDNCRFMVDIVTEIFRYFKLEMITNAATVICHSAIKAFFGAREQIYYLKNQKVE